MRKIIEDDELWFMDAPTKWLLDTTIGQFINTIESHDDWNDSEKSDFALNHLKGPAQQFAKWFLNDKKMEWMALREKLYQQFKSKLNIWEKVELRKNLIQLEDENIKDFFHRCVTCQYVICDDDDESVIERDIMINFLLGMRKDIFEELTKDQLPSEKMNLYSCFEEVEKLEMILDNPCQIELEKIPLENIKIEPDDILKCKDFKEEINSANGSEDFFEYNEPMVDNDEMVEPDKKVEKINGFEDYFEDNDSDEDMLENDEVVDEPDDETISEKTATKKKKYKKRDFSHLITMDNGNVSCSLCNKISSSMKKAQGHTYRDHFPQQYYKCKLCPYTGTKILFRAHLKANHKMSGKNLVSTHGMIVNSELDENVKLENSNDFRNYDFNFKEECKSLFKFKCNFCDYDNSFICKRHLETHIKKEHPEAKKGKKFICKCCEKSYSYKDDLFKHMKNNHASEEMSKKQSITQKKEVKKEPVSDNSDFSADENNDNDSDFDYHKEIAKRKFKCTQCGDGFLKKKILEIHLEEKHEMVTGKNGKLVKNDKVIDNDNENTKSHQMIQCKYCDVKSGSADIHYRHMLNFHPDETFFCKICPNRHKFANFATNLPKDQAMQIHNMIHHGQTDPENPNRVLCSLCNKKKLFVTKKRLKLHVLRVHYKVQAKYQCTICGKLYQENSKLKDHMENAHFKSKIHECKECDAKFETRTKYQYHIANFHSKERFVCEECGKDYPTKLRLTFHMPSHLDRTHICDDCGLSFKTEMALNSHKLSHLEKTFNCTVPGCDKKFSGKKAIREHIKNSHVKSETFTCDQCPKEFKQRNNLNNHINIHHLGKIKIHRCTFCDYEANYKETLKLHIDTIHKGIMFRCDFPGCTKEMNRKGNLDVHKYNSHGIPRPHHINPPKKIIIENI